MEKYKDELSLDLYNMYGITEWQQKYALMTDEDRMAALNYLKGNYDRENVADLIEQLKQPFPKFVVSYLSTSQEFTLQLERDPQLPYKLFFLTDNLLHFYGTLMKGAKTCVRTAQVYDYQTRIENIFSASIDDFNSYSASQMSIEKRLKFTYLTQYIDLEEAKRLGLSSALTFEKDGVDGYEFEKKMDILNPRIRTIMMLFLGLYGHHFHTKKDIAKLLGCSYENTVKVIDILFPLFIKSTGAFENAIGYNRERQKPDNMYEYGNRVLKNTDIVLETSMFFEKLDEVSKQILLTYSFNKRTVYLAAKYMYKTPESLARNMNISVAEAKTLVENAKKFS